MHSLEGYLAFCSLPKEHSVQMDPLNGSIRSDGYRVDVRFRWEGTPAEQSVCSGMRSW